MILEGPFPPDIRVKKEAKALISKGHNVFLLSLIKNGLPAFEKLYGLKIIRIKISPKGILRLWNYISSIIFFYRPCWKKELIKTVKKYKIEAIHVHDFPLVKTATFVAHKFKIPIIADLHENYPEAIKAWRVRRRKLNQIIHNPSPVWQYKKMEKPVLKHVNHIITVVEESKNHYQKDCEIPQNKITVVMNTENLEQFDNLKLDESLISSYKNDFVISYIGGFGIHRGIDTAIKSLPKIIKIIPNAKLLLVGNRSNEDILYLKRLVKKFKVEDHVVFTGWVDFSMVPSYIILSKICLVPHQANGHTNTTIPHKLFQYMAMKKPVIVTNCRPLERIVKECNCGVVVTSDNFDKMADAVIFLYKNKEKIEKFGKNGREAVEKVYNWKLEAEKLSKVYEELEKLKSSS